MAVTRITLEFRVFEKYGKCAIIKEIDGNKTNYFTVDKYGIKLAESKKLSNLIDKMEK